MIPILPLIDYMKINKNKIPHDALKKEIEDYKKCNDSKNKHYMSKECLLLKRKMENMILFNEPR